MPIGIDQNRAEIVRADVRTLARRADRGGALVDSQLVERLNSVAAGCGKRHMAAFADNLPGSRGVNEEAPAIGRAVGGLVRPNALRRLAEGSKAGGVESDRRVVVCDAQ